MYFISTIILEEFTTFKFWLGPEFGGIKFLLKTVIQLPDYTVSHAQNLQVLSVTAVIT